MTDPRGKRSSGTGSPRWLPNGMHRRELMLDGVRISATADNDVQSLLLLQEKIARHRAARPLVDSRILCAVWAERHLDSLDLAQATVDLYRGMLARHALPSIGRKPLPDVKRTEILGILKRASATLSDSSVRNLYAALRGMFAAAVEDGLMAVSPLASIKRPVITDQREAEHLDAGEVERLLEAVKDDQHRALWFFLSLTATRRGEALGVRWADYDADAGEVWLRGQVVRDSLGLRWKDTTKGKTVARIPVPPVLAAELQAHRRRQAQQRLLLGQHWRDEGLIFCSETGGPLESRNVSRRFSTIAQRVTGKAHGPHVLRHSAASYLLVEQGLSDLEVSKVLRHHSPAVTNAFYAHLKPARVREAGMLLGRLAGGQA